MATPNEIYKVALENREALNTIKDKAKSTDDFASNPSALVDSDVVRISRAGVTYKTTVGEIKAASGGGDTNVQSDWATSDNLDDTFILNKPENLSDFNNDLDPVDVSADAYSPLDTGVITGGEVTINAGNNALVDIAAGTGIIMDWTNPSTPIRYAVSWNAFIGEAMPDISEPFTSLYISNTGALIKVSGVLSTPQIRRQRISLQGVEHANGFFVSGITGSSRPAYQVVDGILDYINFQGLQNQGNGYLNVGTDLTIQKLAGQVAEPFINRANDKQSPTILDTPAQNPATFSYVYRDGVGGFTLVQGLTDIDPDRWDDGSGTLANITGGDFTVQRMYFLPQANQTFVTYGQERYATLDEAKAAIFTEAPELSELTNLAVFTTALVVQDNTNDLSNILDAEFVDIEILGSSGGGGGTGGGAGDMLKAEYDTLNTGNSVDLAQSLNGFDETDFVLEDEREIDFVRRIDKYPGNVAASLEINDMVSGWWNTTLYLKQAQYTGGDDTLIGSYTIIDSIEF